MSYRVIFADLSSPGFADESFHQTGVLPDHVLKRMARTVGADSLIYLPVPQVAEGIGKSGKQLCQACISGHYPTPAGQELYDKAYESWHKLKKPGTPER